MGPKHPVCLCPLSTPGNLRYQGFQPSLGQAIGYQMSLASSALDHMDIPLLYPRSPPLLSIGCAVGRRRVWRKGAVIQEEARRRIFRALNTLDSRLVAISLLRRALKLNYSSELKDNLIERFSNIFHTIFHNLKRK